MNRIIKNIFGSRFKNIDAYKIKKIKIDSRDTTHQTIKFILMKTDEKTNEDIATLKSYILDKSKFSEKLIQDHIDESSQEIIIILSMLNAFYMEYLNKNEIIHRINDESENFYVIISGGVSVFDTQQIDCEMNGEEYYKLIINLRKNKEQHLLEKTLEENKINFPIDIEEIYILEKILLKIYLLSKNNNKSLKDNPNYIEIILDKVGLKGSDFGIESYQEKLDEKNNKIIVENELNEQEIEEHKENTTRVKEKELCSYNEEEAMKIAKENEEILMDKLKNIATDNLCRKYYYLTCTPELPVSYFRYKEEKTLEEFDYFGDNENHYYTKKLVTNKDKTELLCFKHDIYDEFISHMRSKLVGNQVDFLLNNFFFSSIYKGFFDKIYLKLFEYSKYYVNQIIVKENDPIKYIYFVKTGNVKIYSNRSIIQNHILIEVIKNILKRKNSLLYEDLKNFEIDFNLYPELKADFELLKNDIKLKNDIHLMTYQEKQCIGSECFFFGFNSLYTARATSHKVEVYKISIDNLAKILSVKNKKALYDFSLQAEKALRILLTRIIKMNNMLLVKYTKQNKELANQISYIFDKAINIIQKRNGEIKNRKIVNSKKIEQKKIEDREYNSNILNILKDNNNDIYKIQRKSHSIINAISEEKKKNVNNKNILNDNNDYEENKNINILSKYDLTSQIKIFDQKANSIKEKYKELKRENAELIRMSNLENQQINTLKKQNIYCRNFFKLSQGDKRLFIKSRNNSVNSQNIQYHYSLKPKSSILYKKFKNNTMRPFHKGRNLIREVYPFNNRYNNYKPYKYDISKSLLTNKKIFEFSIFTNKNNISNDIDTKNKVKIYRYKSSRDVDIDKFNSIKKRMSVINCQDLYNKM